MGGTQFPQPREGFQPETTYSVTYDQLWSAVVRVLDTERISIPSSDKEEGRLVTDYIQGPTQILAAGLMGVITTRYRYTVALEKINAAQTRLTIICKLESMSEKVGWHDISKDNGALVTKLETWLYEKIESAL